MGITKEHINPNESSSNKWDYKWTIIRILIILILSIVFIIRYTSGYEFDNFNKSILYIMFFPLLIQFLVSHSRSAEKNRIKRNEKRKQLLYEKNPLYKIHDILDSTPATFPVYNLPWSKYVNDGEMGYAVFIDNIVISYVPCINTLYIGEYIEEDKFKYCKPQKTKILDKTVHLHQNYNENIIEHEICQLLIDNFNKQEEDKLNNELSYVANKVFNEVNYAFIKEKQS